MQFHRIIGVIGALCFCGEMGAQPGNKEFEKARLGYWRFNHNDVRGEEGQQPVLQTNFVTVLSTNYDGTALRISETDPRVALRYRVVEPNGRTNIVFQDGSFRLRYKPIWEGARPGHWIRLIEIGDFALSIDPSGQVLSFQTPISTGGAVTNVQAPISTYLGSSYGARPWIDIAVAYSQYGAALIVNGSLIATGTGVSAVPSKLEQEAGFAIGSSAAGGSRADGLIDDLETFNFVMTAVEWYQSLTAMSASVSGTPPSVHLFWEGTTSSPVTIQRRAMNETNWTILATNLSIGEFVDASPGLLPGRRYEYRAASDIVVGVDDRAIDDRGRLILLVDQTVASPLAKELSLLQSDLTGDGWTVVRHDVSRHDDVNRVNNIANVVRIKAQITADYKADPSNTRTLFVFGHVTIPYSGPSGPDGHGMRTWPTDVYYGDVDGVWTDVQAQPRVTIPTWQNNDPGDGIFDQSTVPTNRAGIRNLEIVGGRVDFARLPTFFHPRAPFGPKNEIDLLRQYLDKDHRYRHGQTETRRRLIARGLLPPELERLNRVLIRNALRNGSRWFGMQPDAFVQADLFEAKTAAQWGFAIGWGSPDQISVHSVTNFINPALQPQVDFYMLDGSYFGDWNTEDNLLRAALAMPKHGLASMWSRVISWRLEELGLGEPLSSAVRTTANDPTQFPQGTPVYFAILGDPTLRLEVTPPPSQLKALRKGGKMELSWLASPVVNARYDIFRQVKGGSGQFERLNTGPLTDLSFVDPSPPSGATLYQVRARSLVHTGSGSYTNLSQGVFATAR